MNNWDHAIVAILTLPRHALDAGASAGYGCRLADGSVSLRATLTVSACSSAPRRRSARRAGAIL
jgi:hypothetical protein